MMATLSLWLGGMGAAVANHLWQSTAFAVVAWGVTLLLRRNQARVRYGVWLAASVKFVVPFSLLIGLGGLLPRPQRPVVTMPVYSAVDEVGLPFSDAGIAPVAAMNPTHAAVMPRHGWGTPAEWLVGIWACGVLVVVGIWVGRWRQVAKTLRQAERGESGREVEVLRRVEAAMGGRARAVPLMLSHEWMEPGMFGVVRPALIWPEGLSERLDDEHIEAIVAHELMHARRRDNLAAAMHMLVEAAFWFHPLVWWMERRMVEERERACDEAVVAMGGRREVYAEGLLKAVRFCVESPLVCVAGITGADLSRRVRSIMTLRLERLGLVRKAALAGLGVAAIAGPVAFGVVRMIPVYGQVLKATGPLPTFEAVTIKPARPDEQGMGFNLEGRHFRTVNTTVADLLHYAYGVQSRQLEGVPAWAQTEKYDVTGVASASEDGTPDWKLMVQKLLADRFGFKFHSSTKEMPVYELQVAKNGPKLTKSNPETEQGELMISRNTSGPGSTVHGKVTTMAGLAKLLEGTQFDRPVVDRTGLTGNFDFEMTFLSDHFKGKPIGPAVEDQPDAPPGIFTAIQEQLGLKLEPSKGPTEIMVIDHVEKPALDSAEVVQPVTRTVEASAMAAVQPVKLTSVVLVQDPPVAPTSDSAPPVYDVVSVRENKSSAGPMGSGPMSIGPRGADGYAAINVSIKTLVMNAYDVPPPYLITGFPRWADEVHFDLNAKVTNPDVAALKKLTEGQRRAMLQTILSDRFHIRAHIVSKTLPTYDLVIAKGGPKLTENIAFADPDKVSQLPRDRRPGSMRLSQGHMVAFGIPASNLAANLSSQVGRHVTDKTGLAGRYDIELNWSPENASADAPNIGPSIFTAVQEQLGLQLKPSQGPVDTLVVDHVEMPSTN
ncbi:MAG TPA: M56 family metallopeptidase [Acidobacteriaceae bacterium]|jgi:uncharacterized protein (TIGR03435 family)